MTLLMHVNASLILDFVRGLDRDNIIDNNTIILLMSMIVLYF